MTFTLSGQGELAGLSVFYSDIISRYFNNDSARNLLIGSVFSFRVETTNYVNHEQQQTASVLSLTPSFSYCQLGDNYYWELRNYTQSAAFHIIQPFPYPFPFVDSYSYIRENETGDFAAWVVNMLAINSEGPVRCFYTFTCFLDLTGYLARNPTFQDVPDSCHYASLYKAGGEILGRKIGLARENPIDLEVWFLDNLGQELYDHVPRQLIASSNLLDEVGLPFQSKPELENFTALATAKSINFVEQTSVIEPEPVNINLNTITLDPDTDGGDIVPDSALDRRNEQYLKSLCDALAISDRPDGEIKTFEQPKHLESKELVLLLLYMLIG